MSWYVVYMHIYELPITHPPPITLDPRSGHLFGLLGNHRGVPALPSSNVLWIWSARHPPVNPGWQKNPKIPENPSEGWGWFPGGQMDTMVLVGWSCFLLLMFISGRFVFFCWWIVMPAWSDGEGLVVIKKQNKNYWRDTEVERSEPAISRIEPRTFCITAGVT